MKKKPKKHQIVQPVPKSAPKELPRHSTGRVQVGDIVIRAPVTIADKSVSNARPMKGRVIWIHPLGRFHVVEFGEGQRAIRESFMGVRL